jgi:hypothetical protein
MPYCQYKVGCPKCGTDSYLISQESNPIIFQCHGCSSYVVIENDRAYTVSDNFMAEMVNKFNFKFCGQIIKVEAKKEKPLPKKKKTEITEDDIKDLRELLEKSKDSSEIIKKL